MTASPAPTSLSFGEYALIDGRIYREKGPSSRDPRQVVFIAVDPQAEPRRREIPEESRVSVTVHPSASYRGTRVEDLIFNDDGTVWFSVWPHPSGWPAEIALERYGNPERAGDGFWQGRIAFSELTDFDDGIPEEWRPYLPTAETGADQ